MNLEDNPLVPVAMEIILKAGDARNEITAALKSAKAFDFDAAQEHLAAANDHIVGAHQAQTEVIQAEMAGETHELALVFIHAQDTLMTIKSELTLGTEMVAMYQLIAEKLK